MGRELSGGVSIVIATGLSDAPLDTSLLFFQFCLDGRRTLITSVHARHLFMEAQSPESGDLRMALWTGQMV